MKRMPPTQVDSLAKIIASVYIATCSKQAPKVLRLAARKAKEMIDNAKDVR